MEWLFPQYHPTFGGWVRDCTVVILAVVVWWLVTQVPKDEGGDA